MMLSQGLGLAAIVRWRGVSNTTLQMENEYETQ